jgi:hypothetical protein
MPRIIELKDVGIEHIEAVRVAVNGATFEVACDYRVESVQGETIKRNTLALVLNADDPTPLATLVQNSVSAINAQESL